MTDCTMKMRGDASAIAKAAALTAAVTKGGRHGAKCLYGVMIDASGESVTLTATDLDVSLRLAVACSVETPGRAMVDAAAFADTLKAMAKQKGAQVELTLGDDGETLFLIAGRARMRLSTMNASDFPAAIDAWEAAGSTDAPAADIAFVKAPPAYDGSPERGLSASAAKLLAKVLKYIGADIPASLERNADAETARVRFVADGCTFGAGLYEPDLFKSAPRSSFTFGRDSEAYGTASRYLRTLRASLGLPLIGGVADARLIEEEGRAVGMTFGDSWRDYNETRPAPDGWQPPAGAEIEAAGVLQTVTVGGVEYVRLHDDPWHFHYVADCPGALLWSDGAYSLVMPAEERRPTSALTVDVDGVAQPLRVRFHGNETGAIELTAEQVAELCGPVDPSTFVEIPAVAWHQGRVIATGDVARRFLALQRGHEKRLRKIAKGRRNQETLDLYAAECAAFAPVIAACIAGEDVTDAAIQAAGGLPRDVDPSPVVLGRFSEAPAEPDESNVVRVDFRDSVPEYAPDYAEPMPEPVSADPFDGFADADDFVDAPDPVAELPQAVSRIAPAATSDLPPLDLERRLARMEAALGLSPAAKRTPAHAAAIRRAWFHRSNARRQRAWALSEAAQATCQRERANALQGQLNGDAKRLAAIEAGRDDERAALVAEIDRLRANGRDAERGERGRRVMARGIVRLRRDVARTRAERDGIAGNLAAMTRRSTEDARLIERLQPAADRPRIILNAR